MENRAFVPDDPTGEAEPNHSDMDDDQTPETDTELPPGEEIITPVNTTTTSSGIARVYRVPRNTNYKKQRSQTVIEEDNGNADELAESDQKHNHSDANHESKTLNRRKNSSESIVVIEEDDGFPWGKNATSRGDMTGETDIHSITMETSFRRESRDTNTENKSKKNNCLWWHTMVQKLQDNRVMTPETLRELLELDRDQKKHFRTRKYIMNVIFMGAGLILLMAVIVLIIYTDPQFNESMKALTIFLAGRRQHIW